MKQTKLLLIGFSFMIAASSVNAVINTLDGSINFTGTAKLLDGGFNGTEIKGTGDFRNADTIDFLSVQVEGSSGDFGIRETNTIGGFDSEALYILNGNSTVSFEDFIFGDTTPGSQVSVGPVNSSIPALPFDLWTATSTIGLNKSATFTVEELFVTNFTEASATDLGTLAITGLGKINATGYAETDATWNFTIQTPAAQAVTGDIFSGFDVTYQFSLSAGSEAYEVSNDSVSVVPEPSSVALMGIAFLGLVFIGSKKRFSRS